MNHLRNFFQASKEVYHNKVYFGITLISFTLLFSFNALFRNKQLLLENFSWKFAFSLVLGVFTSFSPASLFLLVASCLLAGMVVSFSVFLVRKQVAGSAESAEASLPSLILSVLIPACPSCALSLFGLLGIGGSLAFLPLKGLEFGLFALAVVLFTLFYLSKKIMTTTCEVYR